MAPSSGLNSTFNYVRNSVKVVVSAESGKMYFFVVDPNDPIIQVYERAFPDLFIQASKADSLIPGIVAHFRYPEDIFTVQTNMYGRYHLTNPSAYYTQAQAWTVSPDPGSGPLSSSSPLTTTIVNNTLVTSLQQLAPQYVLAHLPGSTQQTFMLLEPFVPIGASAQRQNLTAFMTASSNPQDYGSLRVYASPAGQTVDGPSLITNAIRSNPSISSELTLLNQQGSTVELGEVAVVPIDDTLLYAEPIYVESSVNQIPTLKDVVVVYNHQAYQSNNASLDNALCQNVNPDGTKPFSSYCNTAAAQSAPLVSGVIGGSGGSGGPAWVDDDHRDVPVLAHDFGDDRARHGPGEHPDAASLETQARSSLAAATAALKAGNSKQAAADVAQANAYLARVQAAPRPAVALGPPSRPWVRWTVDALHAVFSVHSASSSQRRRLVSSSSQRRRMSQRAGNVGGMDAGREAFPPTASLSARFSVPAATVMGPKGSRAAASCRRPLPGLRRRTNPEPPTGFARGRPLAALAVRGAQPAPAPPAPRLRTDALIRGPDPRATFGTPCSHVAWQAPPITSRSPDAGRMSMDRPPRCGRSRNGRAAPRVTMATNVSSTRRSSRSAWNATLSVPSR